MANEVIYFSYGSNMHKDRMQQRCPQARYAGTAQLYGWKFQYDGGPRNSLSGLPVSNIVPSTNDSVVWGVLYILQLSDISLLDDQENAPHHYQRHTVSVILSGSNQVEAVTYMRQPLSTGHPDKRYRGIVLLGAKESGLPRGYINQVLSK